MSVDMNQFHTVFFEESQEHLQTMEELLLNISTDAPDAEDLNSIFRAAHSIKGGSGIFGFDALTGLTHVMETILDRARNNELELTTDIVDVLLATTDTLGDILQAYQDESEINWLQIEESKAALESILSAEDGESASAELPPAADIIEQDDSFGFFDDAPGQPEAEIVTQDDDSFGFFDDAPGQPQQATNSSEEDDGFGFFDDAPGQSQADTTASETKHDENDGSFGFFTEPKPAQPIKDEDAYGFFDQEKSSATTPTNKPPARAAKPPAKKPAKTATKNDASSIRVETTKIDTVVNLVGEMVITQSILSMIGDDVEGNTGEKLSGAIDELSRNIREIQEAVMSMRMIPVSFVFNRFPRLVRDLAKTLDKKIDLIIEGGETEVDKSMIEKLADPLTHLVRNSLDHGIEPLEKRLAAGKPETGTVVLKAEQRGGNILISIQDDGGGLNRDKILEKALSNGLDVDPKMPDEDIWQLIFAPGFSTAEAVTDVSGRGVGMDVVRKNLEAIQGGIDIVSVGGQGSTFTIRLPLTLAIIDGMCVSVGSETYIIPLLNIIESLQPKPEQIKTLANDTMLWSRDQYWPLISLREQMQIDEPGKSIENSIIVLVEIGKKRYGIIVDQLLGKQQVVIKSLERHYKKVDGLSGATIMGDGRVAMIIDVDNLMKNEPINQVGLA
ncbi:MAG TPA: chemotaxis protein CheA [Alteromonas sp.]|jgi:two-component system chemotaxis sensor kinase CheA|nr:chemotaxis protein CheA [Alteromonas sp.]HCL11444.1 chemotaxis protein CheA [Alteromonas sp.]HCV16890.1 chemotaxis protein CheA [Alteromonas sp.]|tara:strand:+ start:1382 stop:3397 length:2016 start_codon:yes stop_codon:yes gene_type:complete